MKVKSHGHIVHTIQQDTASSFIILRVLCIKRPILLLYSILVTLNNPCIYSIMTVHTCPYDIVLAREVYTPQASNHAKDDTTQSIELYEEQCPFTFVEER
jgi:hypothetical protein